MYRGHYAQWKMTCQAELDPHLTNWWMFSFHSHSHQCALKTGKGPLQFHKKDENLCQSKKGWHKPCLQYYNMFFFRASLSQYRSSWWVTLGDHFCHNSLTAQLYTSPTIYTTQHVASKLNGWHQNCTKDKPKLAPLIPNPCVLLLNLDLENK